MEVRNKDNSIDLYDAKFILEIGKDNFLRGMADLLNEKMKDDNVEVISIHRQPGSIEVPRGKIVRLNNKPGEIIEQSDRKYIVQEDGSWKRLV